MGGHYIWDVFYQKQKQQTTNHRYNDKGKIPIKFVARKRAERTHHRCSAKPTKSGPWHPRLSHMGSITYYAKHLSTNQTTKNTRYNSG
ncbi:MAG: hypothetical protein IPJ13_00950 [Saprospiraceae bacterium]|nr:hypothetical protein [Saprospiraceae bacterium]